MCGRFTLTTTWEELKTAFPEFEFILDDQFQPSYNIAPTQQILTAFKSSTFKVRHMRWGLIPYWSKDPAIGNKLFNARCETIHEKPSFKHAYQKRRCVIFATGFYEWKKAEKQKIPYYFSSRNGDNIMFGGIWENWKNPESGEEVQSCAIITTSANGVVSPVHQRMPVIIPKDASHIWLNCDKPVGKEIKDLLQPIPDTDIVMHQVSKAVNSAANNHPDCIKKVG